MNITTAPTHSPDLPIDHDQDDADGTARRAGSIVTRVANGALALFLISSGAAKFAGGHVFAYIEHRSGIDLFDPYVGFAVGVAEIVAGLLIALRRTRMVGAAIAAVIMVGAVAFHLSPWLGVSTPTGTVDGAAAPWTEADFATTTTVAPFVLAIVTGARAVALVRSGRREQADPNAGAS